MLLSWTTNSEPERAIETFACSTSASALDRVQAAVCGQHFAIIPETSWLCSRASDCRDNWGPSNPSSCSCPMSNCESSLSASWSQLTLLNAVLRWDSEVSWLFPLLHGTSLAPCTICAAAARMQPGCTLSLLQALMVLTLPWTCLANPFSSYVGGKSSQACPCGFDSALASSPDHMATVDPLSQVNTTLSVGQTHGRAHC